MKTENRVVYKLGKHDWINSVVGDDNTITLVVSSVEQNATTDVLIQFPIELINDILTFAKRAGDAHNQQDWDDSSTDRINAEIVKFLNRNQKEISEIPIANDITSTVIEADNDWLHAQYKF